MKYFVLFLLLHAAYITTYSQAVINSTGNSLQNGSLTIEYSIGEISITTLTADQNQATQGFLQPIMIKFKDCNVFNLIPNAFSPNNDRINDCFGVKNLPATSEFELCIYNRWGQLVFKSNNILSCWDGKVKGQPQPSGTYVYSIKANTAACGFISHKGTVTIIR